MTRSRLAWMVWWVGCGPAAPEPAPTAPAPAPTAPAPAPTAPPPAPTAPEADEDRLSRLNFIVFDIDSLRADRLEGGPGAPPNLRWLQQRGTLFSRVYPPAGWTLPSVISMLAGRVAPAEALLPEADPTHHRLLPGILAAYGYHTGVAWGDTLLDRHPRRLSWLSGTEPAVDYQTATGFATALKAGDVPEPFFVMLHDEDLHTALMGRHLAELPPDRAAHLARQQYQQALVDYDVGVGNVLSAMWGAGLTERTVVVVLSDHGEALYEHGALGHGDLLWEEVARVPMLIVSPTASGARRVTRAVSTLDVAPTVLDLAGIGQHAEMRGRSLVSALSGGAAGRDDRAFVLDSDMNAGAVVVGDLKLLVHPHGCDDAHKQPFPPLQGAQCVALFDLATDPLEQHDLSAARPDDLARLRAALQTGLQARSTPALDEYTEFLSELQQRGYWEAVDPG